MAAPSDDVLASIDPRLCVSCKGARAACGINPCPLLARIQSHMPKVQVRSRDLWGSSPPTMFVGRYGYPNISVGPMLPPQHLDDEQARQLDSPASWLDDMTIADVVGMRSSLIRTKHNVKATAAHFESDRITRLSQELAMAAKPVDAEVRLDKLPRFDAPAIGEFAAPHGPTAMVERATLGENVRVDNAVERAVSDTDALASTALQEMRQAGIDGYQMERLMSAGLLGQARNRRLVPTRWAITATDDALGKDLRDQIITLPTIDKPTVHFAQHFGNRFHIILLPRVWGFELIEAWLGGSFWTNPFGTHKSTITPAVDWEDHQGRSSYAANTTGGYYAARLPVLEYMQKQGRQGTAIVLREITEDYTTPLGVWVVRETCRRAMAGKGLQFEDTESAIRHVTRRARWKEWTPHAQFLASVKVQRRLEEF